MAGSSTLFWLGSTIVDPILPLQILSVGASDVELGLVVSLLSLTGLLSKIPLTALAARLGVCQVILFSVVGRLLSLALYAFAPSLTSFYPARVLDGIGITLLMPVLISEVSRHSPADSVGGTMGRFLTSFGLASVLGPLICGLLLVCLTYTQVILIAALFPLSASLLFTRVRRNFAIARSKDLSSQQENDGHLRALKRVTHSRNVTIVVFIRIAFSIGYGFISTFFAVYVVNDLGLSPPIVALAFAILGLANILSSFASGMLCDRIGRRKPIILAFTALAAALSLIAKAPSPFLIMLSMALFGLGFGMHAVASWAIVNDSVVEDDRKLAAAYHLTALDAGTAIGATSSGFLAVAFSTSDIFLVGSGLMLGVLTVVLLSRNWPYQLNASTLSR